MQTTTTPRAQEMVLDYISRSQARGLNGKIRSQVYAHFESNDREPSEAKKAINDLLEKGVLETFEYLPTGYDNPLTLLRIAPKQPKFAPLRELNLRTRLGYHQLALWRSEGLSDEEIIARADVSAL